jgi:hypothetical protein
MKAQSGLTVTAGNKESKDERRDLLTSDGEKEEKGKEGCRKRRDKKRHSNYHAAADRIFLMNVLTEARKFLEGM